MKKFFGFSSILLLSMATSLFGQVVSPLDKLPSHDQFQQIECTVVPMSPSRQLYQRRHKIKPHPEYASNPHLALSQATSTNWSGYVAATSLTSPATNSVSLVIGVWFSPTLTATSNSSYLANWIGIDGYASSTVEQIGTAHEWINGQQVNYAWFEMYPSGMNEISGFPINKNDLIGAVIQYQGNGQFQMTMYNYTQNTSTIVPVSSTTSTTALRNSAEWIVEAPSTAQGILPLADFNVVSFANCYATINGNFGSINNPSWVNTSLQMQTSNGTPKADASILFSDGETFFVNWKGE